MNDQNQTPNPNDEPTRKRLPEASRRIPHRVHRLPRIAAGGSSGGQSAGHAVKRAGSNGWNAPISG